MNRTPDASRWLYVGSQARRSAACFRQTDLVQPIDEPGEGAIWRPSRRWRLLPHSRVADLCWRRCVLDLKCDDHALRGRWRAHEGNHLLAGVRVDDVPALNGEHVGITQLASGRFAMIDDGIGFQLVPWQPVLEKRIGQHITGIMRSAGGIEWGFGRKRGLAL